MILKGVQKFTEKDFEIYNKTFDFASNALNKDFNEESRNKIAETLALLNVYTENRVNISALEPTLQNFEGIKLADLSKVFSGCGVTMGQYSYGIDSSGKFLSDMIFMDENHKEFFDRNLTHEIIHMFSTFVNKDQDSIGIYTFNSFGKYVDEIMTEFEALRVLTLKNNQDSISLNKEIFHVSKDGKLYDLINESNSYVPISSYAFILDALLHDEITECKHSLVFPDEYVSPIYRLNDKLEKCFLHTNFESEKDVINEFENLSILVMTNKFNKDNYTCNDITQFYIPLRQAFLNYGIVEIQKESVDKLDDFVFLYMKKNGLGFDKDEFVKTLNYMSENDLTDFKYLENISFPIKEKSRFLRSFGDCSFEEYSKLNSPETYRDIVELYDNTSLAKIPFNIAFGLRSNDYEEQGISSSIDLNITDKDGRNLSYLFAVNKQYEFVNFDNILYCAKDFESFCNSLQSRDKYGVNSFEYGILNKNHIFTATTLNQILSNWMILPKDYLKDFLKNEESFIKEHPDEFFEALSYASLYGNFSRKTQFEMLISNLNEIGFSEVKNKDGFNYLEYLAYNKFKNTLIGRDYLRFPQTNRTKDLEDVKILLSNNFSILDNENDCPFLYYLSLRIDSDNSENIKFKEDIKEILFNSGLQNQALDKCSSFQACLISESFKYDLDTPYKGKTLYDAYLDYCGNYELLEEAISFSKRDFNHLDIMKDSAKSNYSLFKHYYDEISSSNIDEDEFKNELKICIDSSLKYGCGSVFRKIMEDYPDLVFAENEKGVVPFCIYAEDAAKTNYEIQHLVENVDFIRENLRKYSLIGDKSCSNLYKEMLSYNSEFPDDSKNIHLRTIIENKNIDNEDYNSL